MKDIITAEDLIHIAHFIADSISYDHPDRDEERKKEYIRILERISDSLDTDKSVLVCDDYNTRIALTDTV